MLSTESYIVAWLIYLFAALGILVLVRFWLKHRLTAAAMVTLLLMLAALLLTPVISDTAAETFAPSIVAAGFELLTGGSEPMLVALRPLFFMEAVALFVGTAFFIYQRFSADEE